MKRKYLIIILLPLLMLSFLSVGISQIVSDTSLISMGGSDWSLKVDSALASSIDSRNTPYMTAKSSTEKELFLELASLEDCKSGVVQFKIDMQGLTAYKQLPLTEQEITEGSYRPKNVENSFALFDDGGRKVAHIYGSKITDSKGVEVWLDQDLAGGLLTVYLPKPEVLTTLSFPLLLDPMFGYNSIGATTWAPGSEDTYAVRQNYSVPDDMVITKFSFYTGDFAGNVSLGFYNGTTLVWNSTLAVTAGLAWQNLTVPDLYFNSGTYWIAFKMINGNVGARYDTGVYYGRHSSLSASSTLPNPFVTDLNGTRQYSMFATYTVYEAPTPTPSPSPTPDYTPYPEGDMSNTDWWISILVLLLIIINIFLMMLPFALVRFTFGILSLFLCMLALSYQVPLSPYLQTAGLLISALAMLFSVRARE